MMSFAEPSSGWTIVVDRVVVFETDEPKCGILNPQDIVTSCGTTLLSESAVMLHACSSYRSASRDATHCIWKFLMQVVVQLNIGTIKVNQPFVVWKIMWKFNRHMSDNVRNFFRHLPDLMGIVKLKCYYIVKQDVCNSHLPLWWDQNLNTVMFQRESGMKPDVIEC